MSGITPTAFHPAQQQFFQNSSKDVNIAVGAVRSGKTYIFNWRFVWHVYTSGPGNYLMMGNTVGSLERNALFADNGFLDILETFKKAYGIPYRYFPSGGNGLTSRHVSWGPPNDRRIIYVLGGGDKGAVSNIQGLTLKGVYMDEIVTYPLGVVDMVMTRLSTKEAKAFMNCNPESPYHEFKLRYIDPAEVQGHTYIQKFTIDDNPSLPEKVVERYKNSFVGAFYKRFIDGEWAIAAGLIYPNFIPEKHMMPRHDMPQEYDKLYIGIDWGQANATAFTKIGVKFIDGYSHFFIFDEYYHSGLAQGTTKTVAEYYQDLKNFMGDVSPTKIFIDRTALVFRTQFEAALRPLVRLSDSSVTDGIATVSAYIGQDRVHVAKECEHLQKELFTYAWDDKAQLRGEDKPIKQADHLLDSIRYVIHTACPLKNVGGAVTLHH